LTKRSDFVNTEGLGHLSPFERENFRPEHEPQPFVQMKSGKSSRGFFKSGGGHLSFLSLAHWMGEGGAKRRVGDLIQAGMREVVKSNRGGHAAPELDEGEGKFFEIRSCISRGSRSSCLGAQGEIKTHLKEV
jgi:hypothetical protein